MRRYLEILLGCSIAGLGVLISAACVTTINALFDGTMSAGRIGRFEITVNNALPVAVFTLGFGLALIYVGAAMALENQKDDG